MPEEMQMTTAGTPLRSTSRKASSYTAWLGWLVMGVAPRRIIS